MSMDLSDCEFATTTCDENNEQAEDQTPMVVSEITTGYGDYVGCCKWFSNANGFGFLTVCSEGDMKGKDVFVHYSGVKPSNSLYKSLHKGEYVSFDIGDSDNGIQAINVTGVFGGPLMCDHHNNQTDKRIASARPSRGRSRVGHKNSVE